MNAVHINPALLRERDNATLQEAINFHTHWVEKVAEDSTPDKPTGITAIEKAIASFSIGFEIYEYLAERCGYGVIPDLPAQDWYRQEGNMLPPRDTGWTDRQVNRLIATYHLNDPQPDPEDTALD